MSVYFNNGSVPQTTVQAIQVTEQKSNDPTLEAKVKEVASKFICSCGTCGEQSLDTCTCGNAVQQRQFIRTHFQADQSVEQVIFAVNTTYGWMKKEFTARYDSLARKKGVSTKIALPPDIQSGLLASNSVAQKVDANSLKVNREEVFSHFRCPCGKCGMDDLKTCECSHPKGAKEVKAFVDAKIAVNQFSTDQIITMVAQTYGGRKN
ncbi:MAG: cytochrome c-type biogenesis protein CcmH [Bacteroidota bacterium]